MMGYYPELLNLNQISFKFNHSIFDKSFFWSLKTQPIICQTQPLHV